MGESLSSPTSSATTLWRSIAPRSVALVALVAATWCCLGGDSRCSAFVPSATTGGGLGRARARSFATTTALDASSQGGGLEEGDRVLLIGPGFLQLVIAKHAAAAGLRPMVIADKKRLASFAEYVGANVNGIDIMRDATYGMPEVGEPGFGEIKGVVFCAEDALLGPNLVSTVLDYTDKGQSIFTGDKPKRVVCCAPLGSGITVTKEKSMGWIPLFNDDKSKDESWKLFREAFERHSCYGTTGSVLRFGQLLGGSIDGPPEQVTELGLDERIYKMSLEQYRDLKERAFDRFRLGAQVLPSNQINPQPPNQGKMEKDAIPDGEAREAFRVTGGYPEIDRANRHTVASAVVASLMRPVGNEEGCVPQELTVLSKATQTLPTPEEWDELFRSPQPASWPDPYAFDTEAVLGKA